MAEDIIPDGSIVTLPNGLVIHEWAQPCANCNGIGHIGRIRAMFFERRCDGCDGRGKPYVEDCPCKGCDEAWEKWEARHPVPFVSEVRS